MAARFERFRFWSSKTCQACKGPPTPPPCYNCLLKLETPPPTYTSIHEYIYEENPSTRFPFTEEYSYLEEEEEEERQQYSDGDSSYGGRASPYDFDPYAAENSNFEVYNLSRAVGQIAMAFLPGDQRRQYPAGLSGADTNGRTRHMSSPVQRISTTTNPHIQLSRVSSTPQVNVYQDNNYTWEDDRETMGSSSRSLLAALTPAQLPIPQYDAQLTPYEEPLSPRGASPLPCQLLIPE